MKKRNTQGFTLIELMVVIVVLGVLSAAAVPMYLGYRDDARRGEARGAIAAMVTAQQYHFQKNEVFTNDVAWILQRADVDEISQHWDTTAFALGATGFTIRLDANDPEFVNRDGNPLWVQLAYDYTTGDKTWTDDTD